MRKIIYFLTSIYNLTKFRISAFHQYFLVEIVPFQGDTLVFNVCVFSIFTLLVKFVKNTNLHARERKCLHRYSLATVQPCMNYLWDFPSRSFSTDKVHLMTCSHSGFRCKVVLLSQNISNSVVICTCTAASMYVKFSYTEKHEF